MRIASAIAAVSCLPSAVFVAWASGCFGGEPSVWPRDGSEALPPNAHVRITHRDVRGVKWIGPDGKPVRFRELRVGTGRSAARVLASEEPLAAGGHRIETLDPDASHAFTVSGPLDREEPSLRGELRLEAHHAPEPASSCPANTWIRIDLAAPRDDRTPPGGFGYLVTLQGGAGLDRKVELLVHAESRADGRVAFRVGETGCGCIPHARLEAGGRYTVTVRAVDVAGHVSPTAASGEVVVPRGVGLADPTAR